MQKRRMERVRKGDKREREGKSERARQRLREGAREKG